MVGHDDEGVEMEAVFCALLLEYVEHQQGIGFDLEETPAISGCCGDEVGAKVLRGPVHTERIA